MNTTTRFATTAVATTAAVIALFVTGCGDDSSSSAPSSSTATAASATAAGPGSTSPGTTVAGKSAAAVDGKTVEAKFDTTCAKQGGILALALTDTNSASYGQLSVSATIQGDTVQAVGIAGSKGGSNGLPYAVGYGNGQPGGSAKLVKDGNTYKVTGEGVGTPDLTNPMAGPTTSKFDITFACSAIVGG